MSTIEIALGASAVAVVFAVVLAGEDTPINFWFNWTSNWHDRGGWRTWVASPLGGCEKCTAGHLALWYSYLVRGGYNLEWVGRHVAVASWAVLFAFILGYCYRWIRRKI